MRGIGDDNIVTTFCESVTSWCEPMKVRAERLATTVMGEAMASAPGHPAGKRSGAGVTPFFLLIAMLAACGDDGPRTPQVPSVPSLVRPPAADPSIGMTTELDGASPEFSS